MSRTNVKDYISLAVISIMGVLFLGSVFWDAIKLIADGFLRLFIILLPFLDIEKKFMCKLVSFFIVQLLCGSGFYISSKTKSRIGKIVSSVVDVISILLLFIA